VAGRAKGANASREPVSNQGLRQERLRLGGDGTCGTIASGAARPAVWSDRGGSSAGEPEPRAAPGHRLEGLLARRAAVTLAIGLGQHDWELAVVCPAETDNASDDRERIVRYHLERVRCHHRREAVAMRAPSCRQAELPSRHPPSVAPDRSDRTDVSASSERTPLPASMSTPAGGIAETQTRGAVPPALWPALSSVQSSQ